MEQNQTNENEVIENEIIETEENIEEAAETSNSDICSVSEVLENLGSIDYTDILTQISSNVETVAMSSVPVEDVGVINSYESFTLTLILCFVVLIFFFGGSKK